MQKIPIYQGLIKPVLMLGAPRAITILNFVLSIDIFMMLRAWWVIFFALIVQSVGVWMAKSDPDFMETLTRHLKHNDYYEV